MAKYKANELRSLLINFPALLKGLIPDPVFRHFLGYWESMMLLLQKEIPVADVDRAEMLLRKFVKDVPKIYFTKDGEGKKKPRCCVLTFNVHACWHLAAIARDWGGLWDYSLFSLEGFNGTLRRMFNGPQFIATQVNF